jgi:hypothetical protein
MLFWFCISPLLTTPTPTDTSDGTLERRYLLQPEVALERLWATPDLMLHSLTDAENKVG